MKYKIKDNLEALISLEKWAKFSQRGDGEVDDKGESLIIIQEKICVRGI